MGEPPLVDTPRGRTAVGNAPVVTAVLGTAVAFGLLGTPLAAAVGVVPALVLVLAGPLLAFVAGIIALVGVGETVGLAPIPAAVVLASVLLATTYDAHGARVGGIYLATLAAAVGTFVVARSLFDGLFAPTALVIGGLGLVSYGVHRYELLALGLIDE